MARKKSNISVTGKSIKDIMKMSDMELNQLSKQDLAKVTSRLASAANKRIKRMDTLGQESSAVKNVQKSGGKISVKGKNLNEIRREFARARNFLSNKTSTIRGAKAVEKAFEERVGQPMTSEQKSKFWEIFHKLQQDQSATIDAHYKKIQSDIAEMVTAESGDWESVLQKAKTLVNEVYEDEQREIMKDYDGISDYFETGGYF